MSFDWEDVIRRSDAAKFSPAATDALIAAAKAERAKREEKEEENA